jgi:hypothetical protein
MRFEEVLPALRADKKIRLTSDPTATIFTVDDILEDDWEVVEEYEEVEVWDWVWDSPVIGLTGIEPGLTEQEVQKIYFEHDGSKLLGRIEESKRVEKRRKQ